jgi:NAD+ kinase
MLECVAIYSKDNNQKSKEGVNKLIDEFRKRGVKILIEKNQENNSEIREGVEYFTSLEGTSPLPELVLSVGGDGTFLSTALKVKDFGIPIAGVNTGRMGFLANISADDISNSVYMLCNNEFRRIDRSLLRLSEPSGIFGDFPALALNEITIQKAEFSMITINVFVDDTFLCTYWCDGLIISTATGSTAYNLSVGGPILSPEDESIIISPIAPHNLNIRPIILSGDCRFSMVVEGRSQEYLATCDFRSKKLPFNNVIKIERAPVKLQTVMLEGTDFYSTLRNKLMWGIDKRN